MIDRDTNNISLHEVIEQLTIEEAPLPDAQEGVAPMSVELVTLWTRQRDDEPARARARVRFFRPTGVFDTLTREYQIDLALFRRTRHRSRFAGLPIREQGRHSFEVSLWNEAAEDWQVVARVPLEVAFAPAAR